MTARDLVHRHEAYVMPLASVLGARISKADEKKHSPISDLKSIDENAHAAASDAHKAPNASVIPV